MHPSAARSRLTLALVLIALSWIGVEGYKYFGDANEKHGISGEVHIPIANPPLEPDRPDLIEEPKIKE
jgi:hypothetical protein